MKFSIVYFAGAVIVGLIYFSHLFEMLSDAGAERNNYVFASFAIMWVPLSLVAFFVFRRSLILAISPICYLIYFSANWVFSPNFSFRASFAFCDLAAVLFGALYAALNAALLTRPMRQNHSDFSV